MELYESKEYRGRKINIYYDEDPDSPRSWDNVATFVCEYRDYSLGDEKNIEDEIDRLFNEHVTSKAIIDYFVNTRHAELADDEDCGYSYKYQVKWYDGELHDEYILADSTDDDKVAGEMAYEFGTGEKLLLIEKSGDVAILPISLYDHSGITMWLGSTDWHVDSQWDCSSVGFAYIEKSIAESEGMLDPGEKYDHDWKKWAYERMKDEMHTYDQFLRGEVYGYMIENENGFEDGGCWGFFGSDFDENGLMEEAKNEVDHDIQVEEKKRKEYIQAKEKKRKENIDTVQNGLLTLAFGNRIFISGTDVYRVVREPMCNFLVLQHTEIVNNSFDENYFHDVSVSSVSDDALDVLAGFIREMEKN